MSIVKRTTHVISIDCHTVFQVSQSVGLRCGSGEYFIMVSKQKATVETTMSRLITTAIRLATIRKGLPLAPQVSK